MIKNMRFLALAILLSVATVGMAFAQAAPKPAVKKASRRMNVMEGEMQRSEQLLRDTTERIEEKVDSLRKKSVSDIAFEDVFRMLQLQKVELTIEMEGLGARLKLLKEKAAAPAKKENDLFNSKREVLRRYVANQKKSMARVQSLKKKGAISNVDAVNAETRLAEAELRLQEFEVTAQQTSSAYVEAVFETSLAIAERKAKLSAVEKLLEQHVESRKEISKLDELKEMRKSERVRLREISSEMLKLITAEAEF